MELANNNNLIYLSQTNGNEICCDCKRTEWSEEKEKKKRFFKKKEKSAEKKDPNKPVTTHVNKTLGVFLCEDCAACHRKLPADLSAVDTIESLENDEETFKICSEWGNAKANQLYEANVPLYEITPEPEFGKKMPYFAQLYINQKYAKKAFVKKNSSDFVLRMPEPVSEMNAFMLKGKSSWNKVLLVLHHFWVFFYDGPIDTRPLQMFEASSIKEVAPVFFPSKDETPLNTFLVVFCGPKEEKEKKCVFKANNFEEMTTMVMALKKAMFYYKDPTNHPKIYKNSELERVSQLMIRNTVAQGYLEKRSSSRKSWSKRYFSVVGPSIYSFKKEGDTKSLGMIPLHNTDIRRRIELVAERKNSFALICQDRSYFFAANSDEELVDWVSKLRDLQRDYPVRRKFDFCRKPYESAEGENVAAK